MKAPSLLLCAFAALLAGCEPTTVSGAVSQPMPVQIDFGNDSSQWAFDGECDDPRFTGPGMAALTTLTNANIRRDASDCRTQFNAGRITQGGGGVASAPSISFGNDSSQWAFDGECDDPRFQGVGMAAPSTLNSVNIQRDATDCRNLFNSGRVALRPAGGGGFGGGVSAPSVRFGDDSSRWAFDGECDDPRFQGLGMAATSTLNTVNIQRDATDCRNLFNAGRVALRPGGGGGFGGRVSAPAINFGDDSSQWAFDGECDDPRFRGPGMAISTSLSGSNTFRDATDCRNLFNAGRVAL